MSGDHSVVRFGNPSNEEALIAWIGACLSSAWLLTGTHSALAVDRAIAPEFDKRVGES